MYANPMPRYANVRNHYGSPTRSYSPTKYNTPTSYLPTSSAMSYDDRRHLMNTSGAQSYYSPSSPLKTQSYHRAYNATEYYPTSNQGYVDGTTYYNSASSTTSSSQDGYYNEELEELDEYTLSLQAQVEADPEMTTVPTIPTPLGLSMFEQGKTPSGRVVITSSNQTVEFFSCVVNAPTTAAALHASSCLYD